MAQRFFTLSDVTFSLTEIEGGNFLQGAQNNDSLAPNYDSDSYEEGPVRAVSLPSFFLSPITLTTDLWTAAGRTINNAFQHSPLPNVPVTGINYADVFLFLEYLNGHLHRDGQLAEEERFHLPSEDQWEFAARGGIRSQHFRMAGGKFLQEVGWAEERVDNESAQPVAQKLPNELGLYDMSGNIWEMTSNRKDGQILAKGGAWDSPYNECRITSRRYFSPSTRSRSLGIRLAL